MRIYIWRKENIIGGIMSTESEPKLGERRFKRVVEDFVCMNCGAAVRGRGYTDHCPECLWSRHVDIMPGDRKNPCKGMMEPVGVVYEKGNYVISYICIKCGAPKNMKAAESDKQEMLDRLGTKLATI